MYATNLSEALLRSALQLPPRPFSDVFVYDAAPYQDLSRREIVQIFNLKGMASGTPYTFIAGTDYQFLDGAIDWSIGGKNPDFGTAYTVEYSYSRLGSAAASTSMWLGNMWATQDLGSGFPYASTSAAGNPYQDMATIAALCASAAEACRVLVSSEIDLAEKYRRGTVVVDDTKKTSDWTDAAKLWDHRYKKALILARGPVRGFVLSSPDQYHQVFGFDNDALIFRSDILPDVGPF